MFTVPVSARGTRRGGDKLLLQRSCREELQSQVLFGIFVDKHVKKI